MAQGKAFTKEERVDIIQSLKPFLEMGFSRNKACAFIGLLPQTLSNWIKDDESLLIKLTAWENVNSALALANIHQALKNEAVLTTDKGETRVENSWKLVSKLEDNYKEKLDITSENKPLPTPILGIIDKNVSSHDSDSKDSES